jgi:hypothetical protein
MKTAGDSVTFEMDYLALGHTSFVPLVTLAPAVITGASLQSGKIEYQINTGSSWSEWRNLYVSVLLCSGSINTRQIAVSSSANIKVGDWVYSNSGVGNAYGMSVGTYVESIDSPTQITVDRVLTANFAATLNFFHLPTETISPSVGFKLKVRATALINSADYNIAKIAINTSSTLAAQRANLYPLRNPADLYIDFYVDVPVAPETTSYPHIVPCVLYSNIDGTYAMTSSNPANMTLPATVVVVDGKGAFNAAFSGEATETITAAYSYSQAQASLQSQYTIRRGSIKPVQIIKSKMLSGSPDTAGFNITTNKTGTVQLGIAPALVDLPASVVIDSGLSAFVQGDILGAGTAVLTITLDGVLLDTINVTIEAIPTQMKSGPPQTYQVFLS